LMKTEISSIMSKIEVNNYETQIIISSFGPDMLLHVRL